MNIFHVKSIELTVTSCVSVVVSGVLCRFMLLCHQCCSCYRMMSRLHTTISTVVHVEAVCASKILPIGIFITLSLRSKILSYVSIPTLPAHYAENERFLSFPSSPLSGYSLDDQKGHGCGRDLRTR